MSDKDWLKTQLDKIEDKIDNLDKRLDNVDVTLAKQSVILEDHTRRSLANEKHVELLEKKLDQDLQPIKKHIIQVNTLMKVAGVMSSIVYFLYGMLKLFKFL